MSWSPAMRRWMQDAPQHGLNVGLYKSKRYAISGGKKSIPPAPPPQIDEALLTEVQLNYLLTQDQQNILLTDGFIDTEGLDPITTEGGASLII